MFIGAEDEVVAAFTRLHVLTHMLSLWDTTASLYLSDAGVLCYPERRFQL